MTTGKVSKIERGLVYLELEDGQLCWFEPLDGYLIEIGDVVMGYLWSVGGQEVINRTKDYPMNVRIDGHT